MRMFTPLKAALPLALVAGLGLSAPAAAQGDIGDVIGGIAQGILQQEIDRSAWAAAQQANTAEAYRDYLARFPRGQYRGNAESALRRLGADVPATGTTAAEAEARLGITTAQRVAVQRELTRLGYRTYGADGVWGRNTRNAIATWQRDQGARVTGYVTRAELDTLLRRAAVTPADPPPTNVTAAEAEAALRLTRSQRTEIQRQLAALGHDPGVADGLWGSRTRAAVADWQRANRRSATGYVTAAQVELLRTQTAGIAPEPPSDTSAAAVEERLLGLTRAERVDLQQRLTRLGYAPNRTDGTFGPATRRAIAQWQGDVAEPVTGYLTADQVRLIRVETGG